MSDACFSLKILTRLIVNGMFLQSAAICLQALSSNFYVATLNDSDMIAAHIYHKDVHCAM